MEVATSPAPGWSNRHRRRTTDRGDAGGPTGLLEIHARAIVLADGGFQANPKMIHRHIDPAADRMKLRSLDTQTGDGIRLAQELGAATANMEYFYGHLLSLDALDNDELWPYPLMGGAVCDGMLVRRDGR